MNEVYSFVGAVSTALHQGNGKSMRDLLSLDNGAAQQAVMAARTQQPRWNPAGPCSKLLKPWDEYMTYHLSCIASLQEGNRVQAYEKAVAGLQPFLKAFREDEGAWVVEPMHSVVHNLRFVAEAADTEQRRRGQKEDKLVDCGDQLRKCFSVSLQAPSNKDKKLAALDIVNVSIKIYFKLNTLRLCKNLIRTVDSKQFAPFDSFPVSQRVTYKFYLGRLAVFDEKYEEAQEALTYALRHCHKNAKRNKALILKYLVPVGLLLGRLPSAALSQHYASILRPYIPFANALKSGNIGVFHECMETQRNQLIKDGTYLLLEKLQGAVYRRLLRKVWAIHAQQDPSKAAQIPLSMFQQALEVAGVKIEMDEIECISANLIARKYVKGYISHKTKIMVVAKTDPFPPLSMVTLVES